MRTLGAHTMRDTQVSKHVLPAHARSSENREHGKEHNALAGWLSWLERHPIHQKVAGSISGLGTYQKQGTDVSLSLPLSLKSINICSGEDFLKTYKKDSTHKKITD